MRKYFRIFWQNESNMKILFPSLVAWMLTWSASFTHAQDSYTRLENILYRDTAQQGFTEYMKERCRLDLYYPKDSAGYATVVWFHGGGLKAGNKFIPEQLQNQGIAVIAVNYRLHPQVTAPAYIEDAAAAVAWTFAHIAEYGGDPDLIFVSGHSAGGYLTSMVGLDKRWLAPYEIDADRIAGLIPYSGHAITHFTIRSERGLDWDDVIVDEYAPINHVRKEAPPLVLVTGDRELELFGRYEEVAYQARMMQLVGHAETYLYELGGYNHGEMAVPAHHILLKHLREIVLKVKSED